MGALTSTRGAMGGFPHDTGGVGGGAIKRAVSGPRPLAVASLRDYRGRVGAAIPSAGIILPEARGGVSPYVYSIADLPTGLAFNAGTRAITGNPSAAFASREVTYTVTDDDATVVSRTFEFPVVAADADLTLDDWDNRGYGLPALDTDLLMLIESDEDVGTSGNTDIWARPPRGTAGVLLDDPATDAGFGPQQVFPTRIRLGSGAQNILINHNDTTADGETVSLAFSDYLAGAGSGRALYIQALSGSVVLPFADRTTVGGGFLRYNGLSVADQAILRGLDMGVRFIFAFADAP